MARAEVLSSPYYYALPYPIPPIKYKVDDRGRARGRESLI